MIGQPGFFDLSDRYAALSAAGDPLERLTAVVDFEVFRGPLIVALMRLRSFLYQVRSAFALLLGISSENARNGDWWEIDLMLVVLAGAFVLGAIAWTQI